MRIATAACAHVNRTMHVSTTPPAVNVSKNQASIYGWINLLEATRVMCKDRAEAPKNFANDETFPLLLFCHVRMALSVFTSTHCHYHDVLYLPKLLCGKRCGEINDFHWRPMIIARHDTRNYLLYQIESAFPYS